MLKYLYKKISLFISKIELLINSNNYRSFVLLFIVLHAIVGCNLNNKSSSKSQNQSIKTIPAPNDDFFQEIGEGIGLDFVHSIGADNMKNIVETVGGGAA
jgi:hypothetical protein